MTDGIRHQRVVFPETQRLQFREEESSRLLSSLKSGVSSFVYGPCGSGKTSVARKLIEEAYGKTLYIDCSASFTCNSVLRTMLQQTGVAPSGRSNYDLLNRLKEKRVWISAVCLDNLQLLRDLRTTNILLELGCVLVLIADNFEVYDKLDASTRSKIVNLIFFEGYTVEEAYRILARKVKTADPPILCRGKVLRQVARRCNGNITLGLAILEAAYVNGCSKGKRAIAVEDLPESPRITVNPDEKIILELLKRDYSLPGGVLFEKYVEAGGKKSERSFRRYMLELSGKGLVKSKGEKNGRIYEKRIRNLIDLC